MDPLSKKRIFDYNDKIKLKQKERVAELNKVVVSNMKNNLDEGWYNGYSLFKFIMIECRRLGVKKEYPFREISLCVVELARDLLFKGSKLSFSELLEKHKFDKNLSLK